MYFEVRYWNVLENLPETHSFIIPCARLACVDRKHVDEYMIEITKVGGEGAMLRKPCSVYENGRSHSLIKYKAMRDGDAYVKYVEGRFYSCQLPDKKIFIARSKIPHINIGDVVSYRYLWMSKAGMPSQAIIYRRRTDITWPEIIQNYLHDINKIGFEH